MWEQSVGMVASEASVEVGPCKELAARMQEESEERPEQAYLDNMGGPGSLLLLLLEPIR